MFRLHDQDEYLSNKTQVKTCGYGLIMIVTEINGNPPDSHLKNIGW
jgi:hypothetical protein